MQGGTGTGAEGFGIGRVEVVLGAGMVGMVGAVGVGRDAGREIETERERLGSEVVSVQRREMRMLRVDARMVCLRYGVFCLERECRLT